MKVQNTCLSAPRKWYEARKREAECTLLVHEHRRLPMNAIFAVGYAIKRYIVITIEYFELQLGG
ncbi:hypothetical protein NV377_18330 [Paenibacillus sp. T3-5-0-4]|nr:hypothetical protein [Paenibacillus endoradicis]